MELSTCKNLIGQTPFRMVYREEVVILMEYIVPSLRIVVFTRMLDTGTVDERLLQLLNLEEDIFITGFQQQVQKERNKAWHDRHITKK